MYRVTGTIINPSVNYCPDNGADYYFRLWQQAVEAAKLALADDWRCFENTGQHNIQYETREALFAVVNNGNPTLMA